LRPNRPIFEVSMSRIAERLLPLAALLAALLLYGTVAFAQATFPGGPNPKAVATFQSISLYWFGVGGAGTPAQVEFKEAGASSWRRGLDLWYDARNTEYRGSIFELKPNTLYDIRLTLVGPGTTSTFQASTWTESFPVPAGWTITVPPGAMIVKVWYPTDITAPNGTLTGTTFDINVPNSASASSYVLITSAPGTVVDGSANPSVDEYLGSCLVVAHGVHNVILRGLNLQNCRRYGIHIGRHATLTTQTTDLVIEDNKISGWGGTGDHSSFPTDADLDGAVHCGWEYAPDDKDATRPDRIIVQRNELFNPRYSSSHWVGTSTPPRGPVGVRFQRCGNNHVIRHNSIYSTNGNNFMTGIGGTVNVSPAAEGMFSISAKGFPFADSDIHGNTVSQVFDNAIEAHGANRNVRVWGNFVDQAFTAIGNAATSVGPLYVWRNVSNQLGRMRDPAADPDGEDRGPFIKGGIDSSSLNGGRAYYFHNTGLQPNIGETFGGGAGYGINSAGGTLYNFVSRNNIWQIHRTDGFLNSASIEAEGATAAQQATMDANNDLYNGTLRGLPAGAQAQGIVGVPTYANLTLPAAANGRSGDFSLSASSPGRGAAAPIANINDQYSSPDMGAHQSGATALQYGPAAGVISARLSATPAAGQGPLNVTLNAAATVPGTGVTYDIDFGDGAVPHATTATPPAHLYSAPGTYIAKLTATKTGTGQISTDYRTITVSGGGSASTYELWVTVNPLDKLAIARGERFDIIVDTPTSRVLSSVKFYLDNVLVATDNTPPFQYSWTSSASDAIGNHVLRVEATDANNFVAVESRTLTLLAGDCSVFAAPASVAQGTRLQVQGVCSAYKTVDQMEFSVDGVLQSVDTTPPYTLNADTSALSVGNHTIAVTGKFSGPTAQASASTTVAVTAPALTVAFSPGAVAAKGELVTISAAAGDGRELKQVDFFIDGQFRTGDILAPYEVLWQTNDPWGKPEPFGRHTLLVQATDTAGNILTATRDLYRLSQACNVLVGGGRYRVGSNDQIYLAPNIVRQGQRVSVQGLCSAKETVQQVEFYLDGALQSTDTAAPYTWTLDTTAVPLGVHTVSITGRLGGTVVSNHSASIEVVAP
jgi:hypothetical protein